MGLIKAIIGSVGGTLRDQYKDLISCEDMGNDILMVKKTTKNGVITKDSRIIVAPGQVAVIYDSGTTHHSLQVNLVPYLKKCGQGLHMVVVQLRSKQYSSSI